MNSIHGIGIGYYSIKENDKYIHIYCVRGGCKFNVWYTFKKENGVSKDIKFDRYINKNHVLPYH
jgi:hypothetical protein